MLALTWGGGTQELRSQLRALYLRAALGAELKSPEAMLSNRSRNFRAYTASGERYDLSQEKSRFQSLFAQATRVRMETQLEQIHPGADGVTCRIYQVLKVELPDSKQGKLMTLQVETRALDTWQKGPTGLHLVKTRLLSQSAKSGPALPDDSRWPVRSGR